MSFETTDNLKTEQLLRIYMAVKQPKKPVYSPIRKYYNASTFG